MLRQSHLVTKHGDLRASRGPQLAVFGLRSSCNSALGEGCCIASSAPRPAPRPAQLLWKTNLWRWKRKRLRRASSCSSGTGRFVSAKCARYLPEGPSDPVMETRVLILKDEAGRKDKVFLYDSHSDLQSLYNGRYSPLPKRVRPLQLRTDVRRIEIWRPLQNTCMAQFRCLIKG